MEHGCLITLKCSSPRGLSRGHFDHSAAELQIYNVLLWKLFQRILTDQISASIPYPWPRWRITSLLLSENIIGLLGQCGHLRGHELHGAFERGRFGCQTLPTKQITPVCRDKISEKKYTPGAASSNQNQLIYMCHQHRPKCLSPGLSITKKNQARQTNTLISLSPTPRRVTGERKGWLKIQNLCTIPQE